MLDFNALLQPLAGERPAGVDLRLEAADTTLARLEDMRTEVDPVLDPGGEARSADWKGVVALCEEALTARTKDLQIAAFYTQGLLKFEGYGGLLSGLKLLHGLVTGFWDSVHPGIDGQEVIEPIRARPLSWIGSSREFLASVKRIPVTAPIGDTPRSWFDFEQSKRVDEAALQSDRSVHRELLAGGRISGEQWRGSLAGTPPERVAGVVAQIDACRAELAALEAACGERFREDPPYLTELGALLDQIRSYLEKAPKAGAEVAAAGQPATAAGRPAAAQSVSHAPAAATPAGALGSRDEAYRRLREVAEFLRRTEPHSPVPALLDRAVRWGNMNFEKLFDDFVKNREARSQTRDLLGLGEGGDSGEASEPSTQRVAAPTPKRLNG